jgi:hypothetical protein
VRPRPLRVGPVGPPVSLHCCRNMQRCLFSLEQTDVCVHSPQIVLFCMLRGNSAESIVYPLHVIGCLCTQDKIGNISSSGLSSSYFLLCFPDPSQVHTNLCRYSFIVGARGIVVVKAIYIYISFANKTGSCVSLNSNSHFNIIFHTYACLPICIFT